MKPCQTSLQESHPRKGEKKKQVARTKVQASKQPKRGRPQGGKGITKYPNLYQSFEAYQLKEGDICLVCITKLDHFDT